VDMSLHFNENWLGLASSGALRENIPTV
jgi:hypothetical protein